MTTVADSNDTETRFADAWSDDHSVRPCRPGLGAFPSRIEYVFALETQINEVIPCDGSRAWRVAFRALSALTIIAASAGADGRTALRRLQTILGSVAA